jgi:hypothetical protein
VKASEKPAHGRLNSHLLGALVSAFYQFNVLGGYFGLVRFRGLLTASSALFQACALLITPMVSLHIPESPFRRGIL